MSQLNYPIYPNGPDGPAEAKFKTSPINDGGAAFPFSPPVSSDGREIMGMPYAAAGMTLRAHFAGQVMLGMAIRFDLLDHTTIQGPHTPTAVAKFCCEMADTLIAELEREASC